MKEYIFSVIGAAIVTAVIVLFLPDGELSKYVRLLASLALVCAIALPSADIFGQNRIDGFFSSLIPETENVLSAEKEYYDSLTKLTAGELEAELSHRVCKKFGIAEENIELTVIAEEKDGVFCINSVKIGLFGTAVIKNPYDIEAYVEELTAADCDIYY